MGQVQGDSRLRHLQEKGAYAGSVGQALGFSLLSPI